MPSQVRVLPLPPTGTEAVMSDGGAVSAAARRHVVEGFVNWLYDESPIWPDEVSRERLVALWAATHDAPRRSETEEAGDRVEEWTDP